MALTPLATAADLSARGIDVTDTFAVITQLDAASAAIRAAAGCAISRQTSTVTLWTESSRRIELPARPVVSVATVVLDGVTLTLNTDYVLRGSSLWSLGGAWQEPGSIPGALVVTFTHGFAEVPADIVDLTCALAGAGLAAVADGFAANTGKQYESIDDYRVGFAIGADAVVSVMELPDRTARSLRRRFGSGGAVSVGTIR